jgi:glycosyltransferase involved in cell wall biosynthesis
MFFTVVTPTYNRANLLHRAFDSLNKQSYKQFEWLVIDDGSNDYTEDVVNKFKKEAHFSINYIKLKSNVGKARALNIASQHVIGGWVVVLDSDDWCDNDALQVFYDEIIKAEVKYPNQYGAVSALKRDRQNKNIGDDYSAVDRYGCSYIDRYRLKIKGDKWEILRADLFTKYSYDLCPGDRYMAPSYAWIKMALDGWKTVFINKSLSVIEYQATGISNNNIQHRVKSSCSAVQYYNMLSEVDGGYVLNLKCYINLVRFKIHSKQKVSSFSEFFVYPIARIFTLLDGFKLEKTRRRLIP